MYFLMLGVLPASAQKMAFSYIANTARQQGSYGITI